MSEDLLTIDSFLVLGIYRTRHGVRLLEHILKSELRPRLGLISAETDAQLDRSRGYWSRAQWWTASEEVLEALATPAPADPDTVEGLYRLAGIPYLFVPGFESEITCELLRAAACDAMVLAEAPILRGKIFDTVRSGIINLHAAPLPEYQGNHATYWALYHDDPLYVTAHLVNEGVDTGPILARRPLPVHPGDTLADIDERALDACGALAVEVLRKAGGEGIPLRPQRPWQGRRFRGSMPAELRRECERRLRAEEYTHFHRP